MIGERVEVTSKIDIDPQRVYNFGYPVLPDLTTKVNSFDDFEQRYKFFFSNRYDMMISLYALYCLLMVVRLYCDVKYD